MVPPGRFAGIKWSHASDQREEPPSPRHSLLKSLVMSFIPYRDRRGIPVELRQNSVRRSGPEIACYRKALSRGPGLATRHTERMNAMWQEVPQDMNEDIVRFAHRCAFTRSIYLHLKTLFEDSSADERDHMGQAAPIFFGDLRHVFVEYVILQVCKITDPPKFGANENETVSFLIEHYDFSGEPESLQRLNELWKELSAFRVKVLPARNKLISHADREASRVGTPLGQASDEEWANFWMQLQEIVTIIHEKVIGQPFSLFSGIMSDADGLLQALEYSTLFQALLRDDDPAIAKRCVALAFGEPG